MYRKELTKLETVPTDVKGIFAIDNVSGCYGTFGMYVWGNGTHVVMNVMGSEEDVFTPKKVEGLENVENVHASETHIIVMCTAPEKSRKREAEPIENDNAKRAEVEQQ